MQDSLRATRMLSSSTANFRLSQGTAVYLSTYLASYLNFRELHVYLSRDPCGATTPLVKTQSLPEKKKKRMVAYYIGFVRVYKYVYYIIICVCVSPAPSHNFRRTCAKISLQTSTNYICCTISNFRSNFAK